MDEKEDVVPDELPPSIWKQLYVPEKGTRRKNDIAFVAPSGEGIKNREKVEQLLKPRPRNPPLTEFDRGAGGIPRISGNVKPKPSSDVERPKKRSRKSFVSEKTDLTPPEIDTQVDILNEIEKESSEKEQAIPKNDHPAADGSKNYLVQTLNSFSSSMDGAQVRNDKLKTKVTCEEQGAGVLGPSDSNKAEKLNPQPVRKRKRNFVFPYGNYKNYYGYRNKECYDEDPRLKAMKQEWFEGKECLDVGCNSGIFTISIAQKFRCKSILGVDIDSDRVQDAGWHLRKFERENAKKGVQSGSHQLIGQSLSEIISFQRENFVKKSQTGGKRYDTILCLSVTKWVHLNWGDDGLISLFSKIWKLLNPGGYFVLEPQPWKSYENNRSVSETTAMNFSRIIFRPESFQEILLDNIGFRFVEEVTSNKTQLGFERPIFVFQK